MMKLLGWVLGVVVLAGLVWLAAARFGAFSPRYAVLKARYAGSPSQFITVGDVMLHVRDEGAGPVVLMLHSSMTNLREWDAWADRLKSRYRVIRIDWPPYGLSLDPHPSQGMTGAVDLLEKFVAQEKLGRFVLVGSSSGATIAVLYAARNPEHVRALALSTLPLAAPPPTKFTPVQASIQWVHDNVTPNYYPKFYYRMALRELYGTPSRLTNQTVDWYADTNNMKGGFAKVRAYLKANRKAVWSKGAVKEAGMITAPVLLQWGDRDPVLAKPLADKAVAQFKAAKVTLIHYSDVGHYPMLEIPDRSGADLEAFLDRLPPG
jgi:pimeloyl-ACP methyl ester carboxylesterase